MVVLLLLIVILAGLVAVDAVIENPDPASVTIAGQQLGGLPLGGWLAVFAVLGFIAAYVLLGGLAAARRSRHREQRAREREMAQRVAELEHENVALREPDDQPGDGLPTSERSADAPTDAAGGGAVARDDHGRRLTPPGAPHAAGPRHNHTANSDPTAPRHGDDQRPRDPVES
jgi:type II secretory pathway pseudopilin PulG